MPIPIAIHSDVVCPWCWIGKRRLEQAIAALAGEYDVAVGWHPFQLNPGMPIAGMPRAEYRRMKFGSDAKVQAMDDRITAIAASEGLTFDLERIARTPNTMNAHRLIWQAGRAGVQDDLVETLFRAYFSEGLDVGDPGVLRALATTSGLDRDAIAAVLDGDAGAEEVRTEERRIRMAGADGVPFFMIGDRIPVNGAQPPAVFIAAIRRAAEDRG